MNARAAEPVAVTAELRNQAVAHLRSTLTNHSEWVKVHAAEFLWALSYGDEVQAVFKRELEAHVTEPKYRIGIWRVLAQTATTEQERDQWKERIWEAFLDEAGPDRTHAAETLAKLGVNCGTRRPEIARRAEQGTNSTLATCVRWSTSLPGQDDDPSRNVANLLEAVTSQDEAVRRIAAYGLRFNGQLTTSEWEELATAAEKEAEASASRIYLLSAAWVRASSKSELAERVAALKQSVLSYAGAPDKAGRYEMCSALAERGDASDLPLLASLLNGEQPLADPTQTAEVLEAHNADVASAAALAILRIDRRAQPRMATIDWVVIGVYALGMLLIGWYYAARTRGAEDYMLGGRKMSPLMVGMSLFATLLSTISYLGYPGEIIRYGPTIFFGVIMLPLIHFVVARWLIPAFMELNVTSAYEILELKLGLSVRLLGTLLFLSLRLLWMATIIYATTDTVLLPLAGLDHSYLPLICSAIGILTVAYTAMGGLRAVVLTDVVQTAILLTGAVITLVLITQALGGVTAWVPDAKPLHWPDIQWGFSGNARVTVANALLMVFAWYVCTAGSDQMAIQRYLATRDVKAARRTFGINLAVGFVSQTLLAGVGLALLAYFTAQPHYLADQQTVLHHADQLFPRFILIGLPAGLSGLVIAGLMAAAMSSLSSGVNSSSSVVSEDLVGRFRKKRDTDTQHMRRAQWLSVCIGATVVMISLSIGHVEGNTFELAMKVVNLFVAPLFLLFFMALFVPFANSVGTFIGGLTSVAIAVGIAFYGVFGIGMLWIMPAALVGGVAVGMAVSLMTRQGGSKNTESA